MSDLIQRHQNYFPELEEGADMLWRAGTLAGDLYEAMVRYLDESEGASVQVEKQAAMRGAVRRYDPEKRRLVFSEVLRRGSRNFQLAYQVGLLTQQPALDRLTRDPLLTTAESRALARVALASYFAGALLMPYERFLRSTRPLRRADDAAHRESRDAFGHRQRAGQLTGDRCEREQRGESQHGRAGERADVDTALSGRLPPRRS